MNINEIKLKMKSLIEQFKKDSLVSVSQLESIDNMTTKAEIHYAFLCDMQLCRDQIEDACQSFERKVESLKLYMDFE